MQTDKKVSIVIATYNMQHLIVETLYSCLRQRYKNKEIIIYDDCSTDGTDKIEYFKLFKYYRGERNVGVGEAFNQGISKATGDIIILMCADDLFTNDYVVDDVVKTFELYPEIGHVSRFYYQFTNNNKKAVRAWRTNKPLIQANNPSGLAFRKSALEGCSCSNKMFIETSKLVSDVIKKYDYKIIHYDTIAVRVHESTSTKPEYYLKRRVSSPVLDWAGIGEKEIAKDYVSLIQIKNGFKMSALLEEIRNFIIVRPLNLISPAFWFWSIITIITPRPILRLLPHLYRGIIGSKITGVIHR